MLNDDDDEIWKQMQRKGKAKFIDEGKDKEEGISQRRSLQNNKKSSNRSQKSKSQFRKAWACYKEHYEVVFES